MNKEHILQIIILGVLIILFGWAVLTGIDKSIRNQDIMLCESARVSGNKKYLEKCRCYYSGEDISCLEDYGI